MVDLSVSLKNLKWPKIEKREWPQVIGLFVLLPVIVLLHALLFLQNGSEPMSVSLLGWTWPTWPNSVMLHAWLYGLGLASALFYVRQLKLNSEMKKLQDRIKSMERNRDDQNARIDKMVKATKQILIPYRLDKIVDAPVPMDLDFAVQNYQPGMLQAGTRPYGAAAMM